MLCLISQLLFGQSKIFNNKALINEIKIGVDEMYNYKYDKSLQLFLEIGKKAPGHPVGPMLLALNAFWKYSPIEENPKEYAQYKKLLQQTIDYSDALLEANENDVEGIFFSLAAHSMFSRSLADRREYVAAVSEAQSSYSQMKKGFKLKEQYNEFYFSSGLYNYYREKYPEVHPLYKPFAAFFTRGDVEVGLKELETAAEVSIFSSTEAMLYLVYINLRYENKPEKALNYSRRLVEKYPDNFHFLNRHIESLFKMKKYEEAIPHIKKLEESHKNYHVLSSQLYSGLLQEYHFKDYNLAAQIFEKALKTAEPEKERADHYKGYIYAGLARMSKREGNRKQAEEYYKTALAHNEDEGLRKEAKAYLNE